MKRPAPFGLIVLVVVTAMTVLSLYQLGLFDVSRLLSAAKNLSVFFQDLFPPRLVVLPALAGATWETVRISFAGTMLGFLMSLPPAFFATSTLFGRRVNVAALLLIGAVRSVPSILYGVIFVICFGLGPAAGTLGVAFYTVGYLAKIFYEAFEAVDKEVVQAIISTGCNRLQLFRFAILPEAANTVVSQLLFMFEYNIRASTIMGFVGAGGIGYYMAGYIQMLQYKNLMMALVVTFAVIIAIDYLSLTVRSRMAAAGNKEKY